ncbi:cytochrome P450 107B1 [Rhodococcus sp. Br-6]|nr:cytochrome P450 [Rhodococcus sp. OK519]GBF17668.1 cytochrome P450 107B1 [Rhodococcus sp. Br-6]
MTLREVFSTVALLLVAGHETTTNLIGNTFHTLLTQPEVMPEGPPLNETQLEAYIEESLRYQPPLQSTTLRVATQDFRFGDHDIGAGDLVLASLASANRDAGRFTEPDVFDPRRDARGHIAFGHGLHHCIGAPLARLEGHIAVAWLLTEFPDMQIERGTEIRWRESVNSLGLQSVPVKRVGKR